MDYIAGLGQTLVTMGRLMDSIMAAVGLKPSDRVVLTQHAGSGEQPSSSQTTAPQKEDSGNKTPSKDAPGSTKPETNTASGSSSESTTLATLISDIQMADPEQVPEDCTSCRIIGTTAAYGLAGFTMWACYKGWRQYTGRLRAAYFVQGVTLTSILTVIGTARLFDLGVFNPNKKDFTMGDHVRRDIEDFFKLIKVEMPLTLKMQIMKEDEDQIEKKEMAEKQTDTSTSGPST